MLFVLNTIKLILGNSFILSIEEKTLAVLQDEGS